MKAFYAELNLSTEPSVLTSGDDNYELNRELEEVDFNNFMNDFWEGYNK